MTEGAPQFFRLDDEMQALLGLAGIFASEGEEGDVVDLTQQHTDRAAIELLLDTDLAQQQRRLIEEMGIR
jgi:hypothetical protein